MNVQEWLKEMVTSSLLIGECDR